MQLVIGGVECGLVKRMDERMGGRVMGVHGGGVAMVSSDCCRGKRKTRDKTDFYKLTGTKGSAVEWSVEGNCSGVKVTR